MQKEKTNKREQTKKEKNGTVRRLLVANLVAGLALVTVTVVALWALGLLPSVLAMVGLRI